MAAACRSTRRRLGTVAASEEAEQVGVQDPWIGSEFVAAFGDETTAVLMYDTETVPVKDALAAGCLTVEDGRIMCMRILFEHVPFVTHGEPRPASGPGRGDGRRRTGLRRPPAPARARGSGGPEESAESPQ